MKQLTGIFMGLLVAAVVMAFGTGAVMAQEKAKAEKSKAAPVEEKTKAAKTKGQSATKVLFENDKFRVVETRAKPGEMNEMKERSDRVNYSFNAGKSRIHYPDGKTEEVEFKAGDVRFRKAGKSQSENIGKTETHNLVITTVKK
jgi:hypothetical protein